MPQNISATLHHNNYYTFIWVKHFWKLAISLEDDEDRHLFSYVGIQKSMQSNIAKCLMFVTDNYDDTLQSFYRMSVSCVYYE